MAADVQPLPPPTLDDLSLFDGVSRGLSARPAPANWSLSTFTGRLAELSGSTATASLTLALQLILEAQRQEEPVCWIAREDSTFYPPDAADLAVDLDALVVVRVGDARRAARAADQLTRSGAFGLLVLDLGSRARLSMPMQTRLAGLAKRHRAALLCLTEKEDVQPSIGSLISIRAGVLRERRNDDRFQCRVHVLKDKRRGPGWEHTEVFDGPDGLR